MKLALIFLALIISNSEAFSQQKKPISQKKYNRPKLLFKDLNHDSTTLVIFDNRILYLSDSLARYIIDSQIYKNPSALKIIKDEGTKTKIKQVVIINGGLKH